MSSYLASHYDPGLKVAPDITKDRLEDEERQRLTKLVIIATVAQKIPQRLGPDAQQSEIAADKVRCRRIAHVAQQCLAAWGGSAKYEGNISMQSQAAQMRWVPWWAEHETWLNSRISLIATWALSSGDQRWAKTALVRLSNERDWLRYAMRD